MDLLLSIMYVDWIVPENL